MGYYPTKWPLWAHLLMVLHNILHLPFPCLITAWKKASNSWCHIPQQNFKLISLLHTPSFSLNLPYLPLSVFLLFPASITFEESQIFQRNACGRIPSSWLDSINLRWFAFFKRGQRNVLCNTCNTLCINPVLGYIFENQAFHGLLFLWPEQK